MDWFSETFSIKTDGKTLPSCTIIKGSLRISVLTPNLIRIEKQSDCKFCDRPTQTVLNRNFQEPAFTLTHNGVNFSVKTDKVSFVFDSGGKLLQVALEDGRRVSDFKSGNLKGTRRTLDATMGRVSLKDGIISRDGVAVIDDSKSLVICDDGTVKPRKDVLHRNENGTDIYCFAYGDDYTGAVRDFYKLTGQTPLIPRFTLGNWWSRYKAYTQEEYLALMDRFIKEEIPVTVATIDMDWHWVDIKSKFGKEAKSVKEKNIKEKLLTMFQNSGWTGYSWNTDLFPDYKEFLKTLKDENFKVTVNLHPADGVRFFEDMYEDFARFMGINPETKKQIEFDLTDKKYTEGYFKYLHHGYEEDGVDFWWIDWQQGTRSKVEGLDPLWILNHYHSLDIKRDGKRPLILSRYAGVGSHRYPLGFSGDTAINWDVLDFQPYFTATASNIGYSWWSHDIGGHHLGKRDDELYIRWLQFGVFSPIMRLHSTSNEFLGKEPWKFSSEAETEAVKCLRLRHRLIPYIYTMNMRTHRDGDPLIKPMYYLYPKNQEAYEVPNEYFFGSELIVCPETTPVSKKSLMAGADVWLPEGRYTDIFTGKIYKGGRKIKMYRDKSSIPVLAKEGAIIPLSVNDRTNDWKNPEEMEILIYRGNGSFNLYEDDGETMNYENGAFAETLFEVTEEDGKITFTAGKTAGDLTVVPKKRKYTFSFKDISDCEKITVTANGREKAFSQINKNGEIHITVETDGKKEIKCILEGISERKNPPRREMLIELFSKLQESNTFKAKRYTGYLRDDFDGKINGDKEVQSLVDEIFAMET